MAMPPPGSGETLFSVSLELFARVLAAARERAARPAAVVAELDAAELTPTLEATAVTVRTPDVCLNARVVAEASDFAGPAVRADEIGLSARAVGGALRY